MTEKYLATLNTFVHQFPWGERLLLLLHLLKDAKTPENQSQIRIALYYLLDEIRQVNPAEYLLADALFTGFRVAQEEEMPHEAL